MIAAGYDPSSDDVRADPYPTYHRLRDTEPVHRSPSLDAWVLTRHDDVVEVLRDPNLSSDFGRSTTYDPDSSPFGEVLRSLMLFMDPPDHTRLRGLVHKAFTPRVVAGLRGRIEGVVSDLLDGVRGAGEADLMAAVAYPLPVIVICELLGVPAGDRDAFRSWTGALARMLDPVAPESIADEELRAAGEAVTGFMTYFLDLINERRASPGEDLISRMLTVSQERDTLAPEEILSMCGLLLIAGHETTMNLIGNGTLALLRHPRQMAAVLEGSADPRTMVEELLRYDSPVQLTVRTAVADRRIGGTGIAAGQQVIVLLGAANRDPARFERPDELDLGRGDAAHLAFGAGPHFCLGAPLARLEAQIAIPAIVRAMPGMRLAREPEWRPTVTLRGLRELWVETG